MALWSMIASILCPNRQKLTITKDNKISDQNVKQLEFQSQTVEERVFYVVGVTAAVVMGVLYPYLIVVYAQYTNLLIARHTPGTLIDRSLLIQMFGGGSTNSSGTYEERMNRLVDDTVAYALVNTLLAMAQFFCATLSIYALNYSAQMKVGRIRRHLLKAVLHQDIAWHDTQNSGAFVSMFTDGLDRIYEGIGERVGMFTYLLSTFVASVAVSMYFGWELTLVMTALCPIIFVSSVFVSRAQVDLNAREGESYGDAGAVAEEVLSNIRTVVAFGGEAKEVQRYSQKLDPARRVGVKSGMYSGIGGGVTWMSVYFAFAIAFWIGTPLVLEDRNKPDLLYTPGVLFMVLFGVVTGSYHLGFCAPHLETFARARAASKSVFEVLRRKPLIDVDAGGVKLDSKLEEIEFKDVHFTYPARPNVKILKGLSFKIRAGEKVAIVGGSGCGKSTTVQLIQRFYDPSAGSVSLNGVDIKKMDLKWVRNQIGLVGQEPVLFDATIKENICCDFLVSDADLEQAARIANAHDFIKKLPMGYDTIVGEGGSQLSGGQKQRIAIARALVRQPSLLLLDEATSALDVTSEAIVQSALENACRGRTTITISHRLSGIRNVDRILVIVSGRLVEEGTHAELMAREGHYHSLANADASLNEDSRMKEDNHSVYGNGRMLPRLSRNDSTMAYTWDNDGLVEEPYDVPLNRIFALNKPEWHYVLIGSIASLLNGCMSPTSAVLFGHMYGILACTDDDKVFSASHWYAIAYIIIGLLSLIFHFLQNFTLTLAGVRMTSRLRVDVFRSILQQEMAWFDDQRHSIGRLCAKLSGDTSTVQGATGGKLGTLLYGFSTLFVGTIVSLFYSWKITIMCLLCVPFILVSVLLEGKVLATEGFGEKQALGSATKIAVEALMSVRTVQSLGQETAFLDRYNRKLTEAEAYLRKKTRFRGLIFALSETSISFSYGFSLGIGGYLVARHGESYRNLIIVSEALLLGAWILAQVISFAPNVQLARMAAGRLFKILDRKPQFKTNLKTSSATWTAEGNIDYSDVYFAYPSRPEVKVLQGLKLSIARGKKVALVGPSGCGKSTCIQLLQRFYDPIAGDLKINNRTTTEVPLKQLRGGIGIVSQEPVLFDRTIAENIAYGDNTRMVSMAEIIEAAKQANVHAFITSLPAGYATRVGSKGTQLSGGQKQRIAIARTLVRNPKILILDEATSALDSQSEKTVQEALDDASEGRTCIVIAHRLSTITNADVICVLRRGKVVEMGSHSQLWLRGGYYAQMLQQQNTTTTAN